MDDIRIPSGSTILVTGGAGFIGSNICHALASYDVRVRVLDNLSTGRLTNLDGLDAALEFVEGDLGNLDLVNEAMEGVDFVLHEGALPSVPRSIENPVASHSANATGTLNVLLAAHAARVKRVVYASSSSVYGDNPQLPKREDMRPSPISPYAVTKLAGEHYCRAFFCVYGLETVALRYFNVFGPRQDPTSQYAAAIPKFVTALLAGEPPTIYGDGEQSRDFTFVDNVVQANLRALVAPDAPGCVFNVACHRAITLNELLANIQEILGTRVEPRHVSPRPGDVRHSLADISLARDLLGYEPTVTVEEGLRRTVSHLSGLHLVGGSNETRQT